MLRRDVLRLLFGLPMVAAVTATFVTDAEASWLSDGVRRTGRGVNRAGRSVNRGVTRAGRSVGRGVRRVRNQVFGRPRS